LEDDDPGYNLFGEGDSGQDGSMDNGSGLPLAALHLG
jgi:hypothetical protein